jgi:mannan endo-1,4-beta-mannosidase
VTRFMTRTVVTWGSVLLALLVAVVSGGALITSAHSNASHAAAGKNLVQHGSFEQLAPWDFIVRDGAAAALYQDAATSGGPADARVDVLQSMPGSDWYVQLRQGQLAVTKGQALTLTFRARASSQRSVRVVLQQNHIPWATSFDRTVAVTTRWQSYTFAYTPAASDSNMLLTFNLAGDTGQVSLTQVGLRTPAGDPPQPKATSTPLATPTRTPTSAPPISPQPTATATPAPSSSAFVTRQGSTLYFNGKPFRFAGPNIYWLGLTDNQTYPSTSRVDNALAAAKTMGATVVRAHTLGISVGCGNCLEPSLNHFNDQAFNSIDYAVAKARQDGLHLIIPLTDNYHYFHGGKHTFTDWVGDGNENDFYTNSTVIADFETYIAHLLNHVNPRTGIALKNDPTIMAWETGNELNDATNSWTENIARYIKSLAPHQLVADGHPTDWWGNTGQLQNPDVDMVTGHFYPPNNSWLQRDANLAAQSGKVYFVGEYDWTGSGGGDSLSSFLSLIENPANHVSGDLFWSLWDNGNSGDQYTLHYPGDNSSMQAAVNMLMRHAHIMGS